VTLVPAIQGYSLWAPTYDESLNPLVALESRVLASQLPDLAGKCVADIACGTGRWSNYARQRGAKAIGIDRCREMIGRCGAPAILADAEALPLPDAAFDITICALALGYFAAPMPELVRITRPGGSVFVTDVHPAALDRGWTHSFRSNGEVFEIEHYRYSLTELLETDGLQLIKLLEPHFGEPERAIFRKAGKEASFAEMSEIPAVYVAQWMRL